MLAAKQNHRARIAPPGSRVVGRRNTARRALHAFGMTANCGLRDTGGGMNIVDHESQPVEEWREGVTTRMRVSALTATTRLCVFEQWCTPGHGAPMHTHTVEEILSVFSGQAEVWLGDASILRARSRITPPPCGRLRFRERTDGTRGRILK
jgi:mannose-6-phosphate isomerase-like protein (cupin superfamily)